MASGMLMEDSPMEELVDQGLGMEETGLRRPSLRETYHHDSLLAPDTDFMTDDRSSAASGIDVADRLTYLEQRMQMQDDEIQLLKMALADVLKRLNISEEHQAANTKKGPAEKGTHTHMTMQIYLSPQTKRTGSSEVAKSATTVPNSRPTRAPTPPQTKGVPPTSDRTKPKTRKTPPAFTLPLQKSTNQNTYSPLDTFNYKSPLKSPSHYFQICY
uniref:EMAP like 1 n=1 Tax=Hucho hucho TaxID=62062 RepID=A0A4W5KUI0_9TELE